MSQSHESLPPAGGKAQSFTLDSARPASHPQVARNVALVLGGGGAAGNAWEIGIIAGLSEAGLDMTQAADLVVGTSAGATAAGQARSGMPAAELLASVLSEPVRPAGQNGERPPSLPADSRTAMGTNQMDPATRIPAARAGSAQGKREAARLTFL